MIQPFQQRPQPANSNPSTGCWGGELGYLPTDSDILGYMSTDGDILGYMLVLSPEILCFFCTCWWLSWLLSEKDLEGSWGQVWTLAPSPFSISYLRILTVKLAGLGRVDTWLLSQCLSATNCGKATHRGGRAWQGLIFIPFSPGAVTPRFNSPTFAPSTSRSIHKFPRTRESMLLPLGGRGQQIEGHHLFRGQWVRLISVS